MKQAIMTGQGGYECPDCGGTRFTEGGSALQKFLWGTRRSHRFIKCVKCDVVLKKGARGGLL